MPVVTGDAGDLAVADDHRLEAVAALLLGARSGDELAGPGQRLLRRPRQPLGQPLAVGVDQRVDRLGVAALDRAQVEPLVDLEPHPGHSAAPADISTFPQFRLKNSPIPCRKVTGGT